MEFNLLSKTELRIQKIALKHANLNEIADAEAKTLHIERSGVLVTDVQGETLAIDILQESINAYEVFAKRDELFRRLSEVPGTEVTERTSICSEGMLGWIALDGRKGRSALKQAEKVSKEILENISKRAIVFSTGLEVANGQAEDTNSPTIRQALEAKGYSVTVGPTLQDDDLIIAAHLRQASDDGYGLIITSGGGCGSQRSHGGGGIKGRSGSSGPISLQISDRYRETS